MNVQELQVLKPVTKYAIFTEFYNGIRYYFVLNCSAVKKYIDG